VREQSSNKNLEMDRLKLAYITLIGKRDRRVQREENTEQFITKIHIDIRAK
jgi:hypothetical protein